MPYSVTIYNKQRLKLSEKVVDTIEDAIHELVKFQIGVYNKASILKRIEDVGEYALQTERSQLEIKPFYPPEEGF